jgi:hypothetical protein
MIMCSCAPVVVDPAAEAFEGWQARNACVQTSSRVGTVKSRSPSFSNAFPREDVETAFLLRRGGNSQQVTLDDGAVALP